MKRSTTFVLVPGAWHGAWCFRYVVDELRSRGHRAYPLTLTGLADRAHLAHSEIDLDLHIQDVVNTIDAEELDDVVLVGHSYGGFVIRGVAELRPEPIRQLVYLDALVPADGECLLDHLSLEFRRAVLDAAENQGAGYLVPIPSMDFLAIGPEHADWVTRRLTPHPLGTARQRIRLRQTELPIRRAYIHCNSPSMEPTHKTKARIESEAGWNHRYLPTGHDAFVTMPEAVATLLVDLGQECSDASRKDRTYHGEQPSRART